MQHEVIIGRLVKNFGEGRLYVYNYILIKSSEVSSKTSSGGGVPFSSTKNKYYSLTSMPEGYVGLDQHKRVYLAERV